MQNATSYYLNFNLDRKSYNFTSKSSDIEKKSTQEAVLNKTSVKPSTMLITVQPMEHNLKGRMEQRRLFVTGCTSNICINGKTLAMLFQKDGQLWPRMARNQLCRCKIHTTILIRLKLNLQKLRKNWKLRGVQFPIHLDVTVDQSAKKGVLEASSLKQSIESVLELRMVIDIQQLSTDDFDNSSYLAQTAAQKKTLISIWRLEGTTWIHQVILIS